MRDQLSSTSLEMHILERCGVPGISTSRHQPLLFVLVCVASSALALWSGNTLAQADPDCLVAIDSLPDDQAPRPVAALPKPLLGDSVVDTSHGSCIQRLTDHEASGAGQFAKTIYSRSQAFSADGWRVLVYFQNGTWHTVDPDTSQDLGQVPGITGAGAEPQWDPDDPDVLYFLEDGGGPTLRSVNVSTGGIDEVADFTGRAELENVTSVSTGSSGSPSADGRWWAFVARNGSDPIGIFVWDRNFDQITAWRNLDDFAGEIDSVSMSPSGRHVVAALSAPTGVLAWGRDLSGPGAQLNTSAEHSDLARLPDNRDAYVSIDFDASGQVFYVDLDAALAAPEEFGAGRVELFSVYPGGSINSIHFSGKAFNRPGWALVSTYNPRQVDNAASPPWLYARLVAIELAPGGRTIGIAHNRVRPLRSDEDKIYFAEPHASVNRDFTSVVWNSNWEADDALDVDVYAVPGIDWSEGSAGGPCAVADNDLRRSVPPDQWTMLGLPCTVPPGANVESLFGDDVDGTYGTDWVMFRFDVMSSSYIELEARAEPPVPGEGFWFIHSNDGIRTLDLPGGSVRAPSSNDGRACASASGCAVIDLAGRTSPGWVLAGSPVNRSVSARDIRVTTSADACAGTDGCTLAEAMNETSGPLATTPYLLDSELSDSGYSPVTDNSTLNPWDGLWVAIGESGLQLEPAIRVPFDP